MTTINLLMNMSEDKFALGYPKAFLILIAEFKDVA